MSKPEKFDFARSRGIVWVCDLADSSKYLNDNQTADELEEFLPRLYSIAAMIVDAADGKFIKWTGDGFMGWFETPLHRMLGKEAAKVFNAATQLSLLTNVTQLGLNPKRRFMIRHGVAYEQDALLINIKHTSGFESLDLIGRSVVLAFRLAGIPAKYPGIVTQKDLVAASASMSKFLKWQVSAGDKLKYFKGERWGTEGIYTSSNKVRKVESSKALLKNAKKIVSYIEDGTSEPSETLEFTRRFVENMQGGSVWCREILNEYTRFITEDLLGNVKKAIPMLEEIDRKRPPTNKVMSNNSSPAITPSSYPPFASTSTKAAGRPPKAKAETSKASKKGSKK